jgi:hypothetical protein
MGADSKSVPIFRAFSWPLAAIEGKFYQRFQWVKIKHFFALDRGWGVCLDDRVLRPNYLYLLKNFIYTK